MMPRGISRCGFLASSEAVLTASNPMYEKKMIAAPTLIPLRPFGAKLGVVHSAGLMYLSPTIKNMAMMPTLIATITVLTRADSLVPMTRSQVMSATMANAGRLNTIGDGPQVRRGGKQGRVAQGSAQVGHEPTRQVHPQPPQRRVGGPRPSDGDGDVANRVLEDQVPADDPRDQLAERGVGIRVGAPGDGDHR